LHGKYLLSCNIMIDILISPSRGILNMVFYDSHGNIGVYAGERSERDVFVQFSVRVCVYIWLTGMLVVGPCVLFDAITRRDLRLLSLFMAYDVHKK